MATDCLFCRIGNGEIPAKKAYEDENVFAFHDINAQAPTHILVLPRKHIASIDELEGDDAKIMGEVIARCAQLARDLHLASTGYRVVVNTGAAAGQSVFHIHFHLLGGRPFSWPPG